MRTVGFFAGALCALSIMFSSTTQAESSFICAGHERPESSVGAAAKVLNARPGSLPSCGSVNVLVVYARFKDEAPNRDRAPARVWACPSSTALSSATKDGSKWRLKRGKEPPLLWSCRDRKRIVDKDRFRLNCIVTAGAVTHPAPRPGPRWWSKPRTPAGPGTRNVCA